MRRKKIYFDVARMRDVMEQKGTNMTLIARQIGVNPDSFRNRVSDGEMRPEELEAVCKVLDVAVDYIRGEWATI